MNRQDVGFCQKCVWIINRLRFCCPDCTEFIKGVKTEGKESAGLAGPKVHCNSQNMIDRIYTHTHAVYLDFFFLSLGEEALTIFVDKGKLSRKPDASDYSSNTSSVTLETLHQLAASYFIDRESTLHKLHHLQIASTAIKVRRFRFNLLRNASLFTWVSRLYLL